MKYLSGWATTIKINIKTIFLLFSKKEERQLIFVFTAILIMGFVELLGIGSLGPFITIITNPSIIYSNKILNNIYLFFNFPSENAFIMIFGIAVICTLSVSNILLGVLFYVINRYSAKRRYHLSMRLLEKYLRQSYMFYLNINTAALSRNILDDINTYINNVLVSGLNFVSSVIISLAIVVLLFILNPLLALILISIFASLYIIIFSFIRKLLSKKGAERNKNNLLRYKTINETFGGIKDIKILGKEKVFLNFFDTPSKKYAYNDILCTTIGEIPKYLIEIVTFSGIISVILILLKMGNQISDFLPLLTVYAFGAYRLFPLLQKIFKSVTTIRYNLPITENLNKAYNGLPLGLPLIDGEIERLPFSENIKLNNIVFSYPSSEKEIIKNQNLTIKSNTSIALVGITGCGKTTMVDIILGLLEPQSGSIHVDNTEINDTNRKNWQKNLGYVPQSIYLTDDSIRNNIAFGIEASKINDSAVINAAKLANIHDFIENELEEGYNTKIGERGIRLSGGQRQRIGIARAIYHDPAVLILDEATSALDSLTENAIMDAINNLSHKKTIIIIAHRITTVKDCDIIYFMNKGIFEDHGSFDELYKRNTKFRKMTDGH